MKKKSLSHQIILMTTFLTVILFTTVLVLIGIRLNNDIQQLITGTNIQVAQARASELGKVMEMHFRELTIMSLLRDVTDGNETEAEDAILALYGKVSPDIAAVLLVWPDGRAVLKDRSYVSVTERDYFKAVFQDKKDFYISSPIISKATGKPSVILAKAIYGENKTTRALVGFEMQLTMLSEITRATNFGDTGYGWVIDNTGLVIAFPDENAILSLNITEADSEGYRGLNDLAQNMLHEQIGNGVFQKPDGVQINSYWSQVPNTPGWRLGLSIERKETGETLNALLQLLFILFGMGLLLTFVMAAFLARTIVKPIKLIQSAMGKLEDGELAQNVTDIENDKKILKRNDELGELGHAMQKLRNSLDSIVKGILSASDQVLEGANHLSSSAQSLSQGSTEQASSAEHLSSTVEEFVSTIRQNAENTTEADALAKRVTQNAETSGHAVTQSVNNMKEIAGKISIIEEIARQTNLLALNAAIEAARAGEAGKGFAVVASEVRKLAERSAKSAGEINELSRTSVQVATEAGERIDALLPDIRKTADLIQEIAAASSEQSAGAEQIANGVSQMDTVIQQNASVAEELSATAEELSSQSITLRSELNFFKTSEEQKASKEENEEQET